MVEAAISVSDNKDSLTVEDVIFSSEEGGDDEELFFFGRHYNHSLLASFRFLRELGFS